VATGIVVPTAPGALPFDGVVVVVDAWTVPVIAGGEGTGVVPAPVEGGIVVVGTPVAPLAPLAPLAPDAPEAPEAPVAPDAPLAPVAPLGPVTVTGEDTTGETKMGASAHVAVKARTVTPSAVRVNR
jgi:hypothetical protein